VQALPTLRSNEYFGTYGKITRLYLTDRSSFPSYDPEDSSTLKGINIVYVRREDASRAIMALDGIPAPQGAPGKTIRASYGITRYCDSFLRGQKCDTTSCTNYHEWGGETDCFTKEDYDLALVLIRRSRTAVDLTSG
jgi:CCR4-NOT transcription complex subunit 4